jgi:alpha 1,2-mannosyltransferase
MNSVWSNFEIADMDFWRGEAYTAFFEYLDAQGGFYYEVRAKTYFSIAP